MPVLGLLLHVAVLLTLVLQPAALADAALPVAQVRFRLVHRQRTPDMTERHHAFTGDQVTDPTGLHVGVGPLVDPIRSRDAGIQGDVVMLLGFLAPAHRRIIPVDVDAIGRMLGIRDRADQIAQVVHIAPVDAAASGAAIQQVGRHGPFDELAQRE